MKRLAFFILSFLFVGQVLPQNFTNGIYPTESNEERKARKEFNRYQEYNNWNFLEKDGKVYWQYTFYFKPEHIEGVLKFFHESPIFKKVGNQFTANIVFAQYTEETTPMIFNSTSDIVFTVQFKDNRYRVTVTNITWHGTSGTVGLFTITQENTLSMQDLLSDMGTLKKYPCKHANICMLNIFDYYSKYHTATAVSGILDSDF